MKSQKLKKLLLINWKVSADEKATIQRHANDATQGNISRFLRLTIGEWQKRNAQKAVKRK